MTESPAGFDSDSFNGTHELMGARFAAFLRVFLEDVANRIETIAAAVESGNGMREVALDTHSIKAASSQIGAHRLTNAAAAMELCAVTSDNAGDPDFARLLNNLRQAFAAVEEALRVFAA